LRPGQKTAEQSLVLIETMINRVAKARRRTCAKAASFVDVTFDELCASPMQVTTGL
jgi:hypothetical protein